MNLMRGINMRKIAEHIPGASGAEVKVCGGKRPPSQNDLQYDFGRRTDATSISINSLLLVLFFVVVCAREGGLRGCMPKRHKSVGGLCA